MSARTSDTSSLVSPAESARRLRRVLLHERSLGYDNSAVMGGLDSLISAFAGTLPWIRSLSPGRVTSYSAMGPGERQIWVETALRKLDSDTENGTPESTKQRRQRSSTAANEKKTRPAQNSRGKSSGRKTAAPAAKPTSLATPLSELGFLTRPTAGKLAKAGIGTLRELMWMFPRRHIDYSKPTRIGALEFGQETTVIGHVVRTEKLSIGRNGAARVLVSDGSGLISVTFFSQPYLADRLKPGTDIAMSGRINEFRGMAQLENPEYEVMDRKGNGALTHAGNLLPVYSAAEGLPQRTLRNATRAALDSGLPLIAETLQSELLQRQQLPGLKQALFDMHYPASETDTALARRRLAFDELLLNQLLVLRNRQNWQSRAGSPVIADGRKIADSFLAGLDFELTSDQHAALDVLLNDMATGVPMARLLQGEVGSGKTVVALSALLACVASGHQGAFLAPTEVLAEQHFLGTSRQLGAGPSPLLPASVVQADGHGLTDRPIKIGLLTGSLPLAQKAKMHELIAAGAVDIVIGTHALLQDAVEFPRLALAVVDEQHRFGVEQRAALGQRTPRPHMLAMSATPIPRTLALTVYGDLDISMLKQMPSGRRPLQTTWARDEFGRRDAFEELRSEVAEGRQAFVVCPLIDESDAITARSATTEYEYLRNGPLSDLRIGLLHGRMTMPEKQAAMEKFRQGETQVLVATPVIEVGVDVPNATVMLIESADRFGLSQLHQLRGRVGRGGHAGKCFLLSDNPSDDAIVRLRTVEHTNDGFELADRDLELRGPGEYTGTRQSGWALMKVATPADHDLIEVCREEASRLLADDPGLVSPANLALSAELDLFAQGRPAELS